MKISILTNFLLYAGMTVAAVLVIPWEALALTQWSGSFFVEETVATSADQSSKLFQSGVNLQILPPMKKNLNSRFSARFDYTNANGERAWNLSPIGNLGADLAGETYSLNLQHIRTATVTSAAELVENTASRFALTLFPAYWPRVTFNYSLQETSVDGRDSTSDNFSLFGDYRYRWLNTRGGYSRNTRDAVGISTTTDSLFFGLGGSYEVLRQTLLTGDIDISRYSSETTGPDTTTLSKAFRLGLTSRPVEWFGFSGNFSWNAIESGAETGDSSTSSRYADFTGTVYPLTGLRLWTTIGNRSFNDLAGEQSIDFFTVGAGWDRRLHDKITFGTTLSRTSEKDPDQGENTRDNMGVNSTMDLTPRSSLRLSLSVSRNEFPAFVSTERFGASGPLADRVLYDDRPVGFTFFDTDNNDLYTRNSPLPGLWSAPAHIEPPTEERFSTTKSAQLNMRPTDNTGMTLFYTSINSSETLDLLGVGTQNLNGSFNWQPNRRTSYGLSGTMSIPQTGDTSFSGAATFSYRFLRRHQMTLSYARRSTGSESSDSLSGTMRLTLRKKSSVDLTYSASQLFQEEQNEFFRVRFVHAF